MPIFIEPSPLTDFFGYALSPFLCRFPKTGFVVVYDTEFTSWSHSLETGWKSPNQCREVFQFGALKINLSENWQIVDELCLLIKPTKNPELSDYICNLTGITNNMMTQALSVGTAFEILRDFCTGCDYIISNGWDGCVVRETLTLGNANYNFSPEHGFPKDLDVRPFFCSVLDASITECNTCNLPQLTSKVFSGERPHNALCDARKVYNAMLWIKERNLKPNHKKLCNFCYDWS